MTNVSEWSTAGMPATEQFGSWEQIVAEAFVRVDLTRDDEGGFPSRVFSRRVGPVQVSQIASLAQTVCRREAHLSPLSGDVYFLNLPLGYGTYARQDGRTAHLAPGDFALVDSTRPFELEFEDRFEQVSLTIPHEFIASRLVSPESATAVRVDGSTGVGAVASAAIRASVISGGMLDPSAARSLAEHLSGLICLALGGVSPTAPVPARALLAQAARDEVERSLADPGLSRALVAERLAISTRYLDRLFADDGTSFNRWLLARRLERSRGDLFSETSRERSVAEIALAVGFLDPSYFARVFRARYGVSPGDARRRARMTAAAQDGLSGFLDPRG